MNTDKIYAEAIANEYAPKDTSKVVALKKLDWKARSKATIFAYGFGIGMTLVLGIGMCLSMQVIGDGGILMTAPASSWAFWALWAWASTTLSTKGSCGLERKSMPLRSCSWPGRSARRRSNRGRRAADEQV